jgi:hypothetical protein
MHIPSHLHRLAPCLLALAIAAAPLAALAQRHGGGFGHGGGHAWHGGGGGWRGGGYGWHGGGYGWNGGWGWGWGAGFGYDPLWGWPGYYYGGYYDAPYAMVESVPAAPAVPAPPQYYYCDSPKGYYPAVATCQLPWRPVAPVAPPAP